MNGKNTPVFTLPYHIQLIKETTFVRKRNQEKKRKNDLPTIGD